MRTRAGSTAGPLRPTARRLLLFALLTGLLAMHGLGPGPAPSADGHTARAAHARATASQAMAAPRAGAASHAAAAPHAGGASTTAAASESEAPCACADDGADDGGGGHGRHADPACAAPGTAGAPVLPAPAAAPGSPAAATAAALGVLPGPAVCGRAPPSLSQLQLLRI
ncbi:DUF6153 family protein [Streptomyces sp. NPDC059982]|uniref:DUF6153 family protein n=1 Tax=Streptomyces sp. NPDC059982 TaxID=3347024 RepID=UPI0036CC2902